MSTATRMNPTDAAHAAGAGAQALADRVDIGDGGGDEVPGRRLLVDAAAEVAYLPGDQLHGLVPGPDADAGLGALDQHGRHRRDDAKAEDHEAPGEEAPSGPWR